MALYRLLFFDPDRHIESVREIAAASDIDALEAARHETNERHSELWCGSRLVDSFHAPRGAD